MAAVTLAFEMDVRPNRKAFSNMYSVSFYAVSFAVVVVLFFRTQMKT